jgi:hypothetical protein
MTIPPVLPALNGTQIGGAVNRAVGTVIGAMRLAHLAPGCAGWKCAGAFV